MKLRTWAIASLAAVTLAVVVLTASADDDEKIVIPKPIRESVNKMADDIGKDKNVDQAAAAFVNAHQAQLKQTMWIFKPRDKDGTGGFGIGPKPGPFKVGDAELPDGIEGAIITLGNPRRAALKAEHLKKAAPDFQRLADVTLAISEILSQYNPVSQDDKNNPQNWKKFADQMKESAKELKAAVDTNKPDAVKKAFTKLYSSCTDCHSIFRDDVKFKAPPKSFLDSWKSYVDQQNWSGVPQNRIVVPPNIRDSLTAMADAYAKGENIDKQADAFFKDHKGDFKTVKGLLQPRAQDGTGGFGIGPKRGRYDPDEIAGYIRLSGGPRATPMPEPQLKAAADDLNRLADIVIAMAEVTRRYKPKNIVIGGPTIAKPEDWTKSANDMKEAAIDLKSAVKANKPDDVKTAFTKLNASCVKCHSMFGGRMK